MNLQITLDFHGRTEEAVEFYRRAVGAEVLFMMRFHESPDQSFVRSGLGDKIYHTTFRVGSTDLMASDCGCTEPPPEAAFVGFSLALRADSTDEAEQFFTALSEDGQIQIPLTETFFASRYGIVVDQFGISWKVMVECEGTS